VGEAQVLRPDRGGKAVDGVIGAFDDLLDVVVEKGTAQTTGPKISSCNDLHARVGVGEDGGTDKVAALDTGVWTAGGDVRAFAMPDSM
jgi:hypothetical protein